MSELDAFDYDLPKHLIAQFPTPKRVDARLLVLHRTTQTLEHAHIRDLPELLRPKDCLVLNNSRVVPARLLGQRLSTGGRWQGLFLRQDDRGLWWIVCKARGTLVAGESIQLLNRQGIPDIQLKLVEKFTAGGWLVAPQTKDAAWDILERVGRVPLPHYIRNSQQTDEDVERYQTVYAAVPGSAAAPTAGLHFTKELLSRVRAHGVSTKEVTLHVGLDTFSPVKVQELSQHVMHAEWGQLDAGTAEHLRQTRQQGGRVVAVGTTTVRVLESAAAAAGEGESPLSPWTGETRLFIRPPYTFRAVDVLLTNFHLPKSTLLMLVSAFAGPEFIMQAYQAAIEERYRFFSYGDAMLIL